MSAAGGTAGSCLLNFFEVSNDLGSAFLDGFAVGTHYKAAHAFHERAGFRKLTTHALGLGIGAGDGTA